MQTQFTDTAGVEDETSTIDDIKALAPVTEEWLKAKTRQYSAGKHLIEAEWALSKKSLLTVVLLALLFTSFVTVFWIAVNLTIAFGLIQINAHWLIIAVIALLLNLGCILLCGRTIKRVSANISLSMSKQVLTGKVENTGNSNNE